MANTKPLGRAGWMPHVTTAPPVLVTETLPTSVPRVNTWSPMDRMAWGSLMVTVKEVVSSPPELLAYTVYVTGAVWLTVGVPLMVPLAKFKPLGSAGWMPQVATWPPMFVTVMVPTSLSLVNT